MADPVIRASAPRELTEAERALLKAATGNDYTAVVPGIAGDGQVGLVSTEGADILIFSEYNTDFTLMAWDDVEIATIHRGADPTVDRLVELADRISGTPEEDAGQITLAPMQVQGEAPKPGQRLTFSAELHAFIQGKDVPSELPITFIHANEPEERQRERLKSFGRFYESLSPAMRESVSVIDFRPPTEVGGYAQGALRLARISNGDVCSGTAYHEVAHLLTHRIRSSIEPEWKAAADDVYLNVPGNQYIRDKKAGAKEEDRQTLRSKGLIDDYARANYDEDISVLTERIYSDPDEVKRAIPFSPRFAQKIEVLYRHNYISAEQYLFLLTDGPVAEQFRDEQNADSDWQVAERHCGPESTELGAEEGFHVSLLKLFWR